MTIRSLLRYRMADRGIRSLTEMMRITGLSRTALLPLDKNEGLEGTKLETIEKICASLNCPIEDVIQIDHKTLSD